MSNPRVSDQWAAKHISAFDSGGLRARFERSILSTGNCRCCKRPWKQPRSKNLGFYDGVHHSRQLKGDVLFGWIGVDHHSTPYAEFRACFPLCQSCWEKLGTAEARIPYYRSLFESWERDPHGEDYWDSWIGCLLSLVEGR